MKKILAVAAVAVLALGAHAVVNPLMSASSLRSAMAAHDGPAVAAKIDFESLRADIHDKIELALEAEKNPMAREMARGMIGEMVNGMVTEEAVASWGKAQSMLPKDIGFGGKPGAEELDYSLGFGFTRFTVTLNTDNGPVDLIMAPRGITWKVVGVDFDPTLLGLGSEI